MARKFISFLGTADYTEVFYEFKDKRTNLKVQFVQEALIELTCSDFDVKKDKIIILLTEKAKEVNWGKLKNALINKNIPEDMIIPFDIPDEKGEAGIWHLFAKIYNEVLQEDDTVIFDITNAFRFLPVVMYSVLRYAQYLKNVSLEGIYYGAYDQMVDGIEPIIDLTETYEIIEWASAANLFSSYGIATDLFTRIKKQNKDFTETGKLSESIRTVSQNINYARGLRVIEGTVFKNCKDKINTYINDEKINPALPPILATVIDKIKDFESNSVLNFIPAVQWYIEHDMPAEALSMMKEGIVSYLLFENNQDYKNAQLRLVLGKRLAYFEGKKAFDYKGAEKFEPIIEEILSSNVARELKAIVETFNRFRNDIDHCGFGQDSRSPENLKKEINSAYKKIEGIFAVYKYKDAIEQSIGGEE